MKKYKVLNLIIFFVYAFSIFGYAFASVGINSTVASFNNTLGLSSTNVQDAIDELYAKKMNATPASLQPSLIRITGFHNGVTGRGYFYFYNNTGATKVKWGNSAVTGLACGSNDSTYTNVTNGTTVNTWHDISGCLYIRFILSQTTVNAGFYINNIEWE